MPNAAFRNFSGGEIAPAFYARTDLAKYQSCVRTMRNFIAQKPGGAAMRPGTEFIDEVKDSTRAVRLIRFMASDAPADIYVLEFGNGYIRFFQNGLPVLDGDPVEVATPYLAADLPLIQFVQVQNTMTLTHASYPTQELTRVSHLVWTLTATVWGPAAKPPTGLALSGGTAGAIRYWAVTTVDDVTGEESLAAVISAVDKVPNPTTPTPTVVSWSLVTGFLKYNVYRSVDGSTFGYVGSVGGANLAATVDSSWVTATADVDTGTLETWTPSAGQARNDIVAVATDKATNGVYTVTGRLSLAATNLGSNPFTTQGRVRAFYKRGAETRVDAGIIYISPVMLGETTAGPFSFTGTITVPDNGYSALEIDLVPEVYGTGDGSFLTFHAGLDESSGSISWSKGGTSFSDAVANPDMTQAPPTPVTYFQNAGDYPACVGRYQQRQVFANSNNKPGFIWASHVAGPRNFTFPTPPLASDPIAFEMESRKAIVIRHVLDLARLVVFTASEERIVEGETQTGILKPDAINVRSYSYNGANTLAPLTINDVALYVQARGNQVRTLRYDSQAQSQSADLTVLASHLFKRRTLVDWDYSATPDSIVWVVRSDGVLLGLTFLTDQDVWGWHRHDTDGAFENVCVVPEGTEDRVYVVVRRTIGGVVKRFIERLALGAVKGVTDVRDLHYMDSGIVAYDGRNTDTANPVTLSGGTAWTTAELLTVTAVTAGTFDTPDVGRTLLLIGADGARLYFTVASAADVVATGYPESVVPASLRGAATADWARCSAVGSGLSHLNGKSVAILADGLVLASPNNATYPTVTVASGGVTLSRPYSVIRVGLSYIADLETLDIDTAPSTLKGRKRLVSRAVLFLENSGDVYAGLPDQPTAADPLAGLNTIKLRDTEDYTAPLALVTDDRDVILQSRHNTNGRVLVRQVDPLPTTVLMISPAFSEE